MTEPAAPSGGKDPFLEAAAGIRDTAKWVVGGVVGTAAGVLAGAPLTHLGSLEVGWRLAAAVAGAGAAFAALAVILWFAVEIIVSEAIGLSDLAYPGKRDRDRAKRVENRLKDRLPGQYSTLACVAAASTRLTWDAREAVKQLKAAEASGRGVAGAQIAMQKASARYHDLADQILGIQSELVFEYRRTLFMDRRLPMGLLTMVVIAGVAVYAWAADPQESKVLLDAPRTVPVTLTAQSAAEVMAALPKDCRVVPPVGTPITMLAVYELGDRSELIYEPSGAGCRPIRLTQQNGRVFKPK